MRAYLIFCSPAHPNLASVAVVVLSLTAPISFFGPRTLTHFCLLIPVKKDNHDEESTMNEAAQKIVFDFFIEIPSQTWRSQAWKLPEGRELTTEEHCNISTNIIYGGNMSLCQFGLMQTLTFKLETGSITLKVGWCGGETWHHGQAIWGPAQHKGDVRAFCQSTQHIFYSLAS